MTEEISSILAKLKRIFDIVINIYLLYLAFLFFWDTLIYFFPKIVAFILASIITAFVRFYLISD